MQKQHSFPEEVKYQLKLIMSISLGMFLFMLFFLPFEHRELEFNNRLLFIAGLGSISFVIMGIFRILLPSTLDRIIKLETFKITNEVVIILLIWVFNALAYMFYIRYVGMSNLTLFTGVKIVLFSSVPSIILKLADVNKSLRDQLKHLVGKNIRLERYVSKEDMTAIGPIQILSESQTDNIEIHPDDLMMIRSADNYVNIIYKDGEQVKRKMLRNTITNIQSRLRKYPQFLRCHRTCIINSHYIVNLTNSYKGYRLKILDYDDEIPVSRQYILDVKEYMDTV